MRDDDLDLPGVVLHEFVLERLSCVVPSDHFNAEFRPSR